MPQLTFSFGPIASRIPKSVMPRATILSKNAASLLDPVLARQTDGSVRVNCTGSALPSYVASRRVRVEDVYLPFRPNLTKKLVDSLLWKEKSRTETDQHRLLKAHARVLARSFDPDCLLEPETRLPNGSWGRADLIAWNAYGLPTIFEAGATDGRTVLRFLEEGALRVFVLPFVGLGELGISGYCFSLSGTPRIQPLSYAQGHAAFTELIEPFALPLAA